MPVELGLDKICPNVIVYHASCTQSLYQMTNRWGYLLDQNTEFCFVVMCMTEVNSGMVCECSHIWLSSVPGVPLTYNI